MFDILKSLRVHGQGSNKYENVRIGINGCLDTLQAAVVLAKMQIFEQEMEARQVVSERYSMALSGRYVVPTIPENNRSAWAQYSLITDNREEKINRLKTQGIPTAIYYPKPLHLQKAFASLGYEKGHCPIAEEIATKIFSIPMHPYLNNDDQDQVIQALLKI
jgi:UDP-2-acetamido-2-deoxy-ribo-hexuluronate aminotransferase